MFVSHRRGVLINKSHNLQSSKRISSKFKGILYLLSKFNKVLLYSGAKSDGIYPIKFTMTPFHHRAFSVVLSLD